MSRNPVGLKVIRPVLARAFALFYVLANVWLAMRYLHLKRDHPVEDLRYEDPSQTFTYVGNDYPVWYEPNHPPVEMTFSESKRYTSHRADKPNWTMLQAANRTSGFIRLGPDSRMFAVAMFHELHCVYILHRAFTDPTFTHEESEHHVQHCLTYLRQLFLCSADATLEPGDFETRTYETDVELVTRSCRDWEAVYSAEEKNYEAWVLRHSGIPS